MEEQINNPLVIRCKNCGGNQQCDIVKRQFVCAHCGSVTEMDSQKAESMNWRRINQQHIQQNLGLARNFACPSCGAHTMASADDASAQCPFCQSTMVDASFAGADLPEVIIPFKITQEEAEKRLKAWLAAHPKNPATQAIQSNLHRFTGCYLPYHIVRGVVDGDMSVAVQSDERYNYPFKGYLSHTAVNASKDWNNLFLDGIEPFDFDDTRAFDFRYLNGHKAKIQNVKTKSLEIRMMEETRHELYKVLSKKIRTKEISVDLHEQDTESINALLPVYLVRCNDDVAAAVNGQTGKVSVATGEMKNLTGNWWLWPAIATFVVFLVGCFWQSLSFGASMGMFFGLMFFAIAHDRHKDEMVREVLTYPKTSDTHNDTRTEFFADFGDGPVPTELKFFTSKRIVKTILIILAVIFLPVLISIPIQLLRGLPLSSIKIGYGAAWYCIPGFLAILAAGGLAKAMMYRAPLYFEKLPNGKTRQRKTPQQNKSSWKKVLSNSKLAFSTKSGCFLFGFLALLLIGSVAAMLS